MSMVVMMLVILVALRRLGIRPFRRSTVERGEPAFEMVDEGAFCWARLLRCVVSLFRTLTFAYRGGGYLRFLSLILRLYAWVEEPWAGCNVVDAVCLQPRWPS